MELSPSFMVGMSVMVASARSWALRIQCAQAQFVPHRSAKMIFTIEFHRIRARDNAHATLG
jgi:hypothetical protein